jgi:predicted RNase H-like nuclease (RuvC/YqgF family)
VPKTISVSTPKAEAWRQRIGLEPSEVKHGKRKKNRERIRRVDTAIKIGSPAQDASVDDLRAQVQQLKTELAKEVERRNLIEQQSQRVQEAGGPSDDYRRKYQQSQNQNKQLRANYEQEKKARHALERRLKEVTEVVNQLAADVERLRKALVS